jgi:hypothetical protein
MRNSANHPYSQWDFFTGTDPTGGNVNYQSKTDAQSKGLAYVNDCDNSTVLAVDSTSTVASGGQRDSCVVLVFIMIYEYSSQRSVRITSQKSYNSGLFVIDASNMPVGCSTWPSFWTVGPNWPSAGEIDIIEGVNNQATNQMTLHSGTSQSCSIAKSNSSTDHFTGQVLGTNCYSTQNADAGCGVEDTDTRFASHIFLMRQLGPNVSLWQVFWIWLQ